METKDQDIKGKEAFKVSKIIQNPLVQRHNIVSDMCKDEDDQGERVISYKKMQVAMFLSHEEEERRW